MGFQTRSDEHLWRVLCPHIVSKRSGLHKPRTAAVGDVIVFTQVQRGEADYPCTYHSETVFEDVCPQRSDVSDCADFRVGQTDL